MGKIRLIKPYLSQSDISDQLTEIFESGIFTKGRFAREFPERIADYTGAQHAFLTTSATTALWMCLKAADVGPGDEVAVSDFSFPATVNVIEDLGATPVFIDVSPDTYNMLPDQLENRISNRMKACMFVDALGNPSGLDAVGEICHANGVVLIEDAACAIGSRLDGRKVGSIADLTCFSFHPRKLITCGEGGAITTDNDEYAAFFRTKLNHGADPETGEYVTYGYNFRMAEIPCLMGISQLARIDQVIEERRMQRDRYADLLEPIGFVAQKSAPNAYHNMQSIVFTVPDFVERNELSGFLAERGIESTIGTYSQSACMYYQARYHDVQPNGQSLERRTITLPCYHGIPIEEVCEVCAQFVG